MKPINLDHYDTLYENLQTEYTARFPRSGAAQQRAVEHLLDGGSHTARQWAPYALRITSASGAWAEDLDGYRFVDFWQGHYANILGHNPTLIRECMIEDLQRGYGMHTGLLEEREAEYTCQLAKAVCADQVRLTTAGTLATMYAIMLARAYTGRTLVLKISGGWHGANPLALKGVGKNSRGYDRVDSAGVPDSTGEELIVTPFNDCDNLRKIFRSLGDRIAAFIFEPCLGAAGFVPANPEFMQTARELTAQYGTLLILDEVITGFRFCAGAMHSLYGVKPDLATYGKIIGGGMPISAVAGHNDIMQLASNRAGTKKVMFNGGTFSSLPLALLAGSTMLSYLSEHEKEIYPRLKAKGQTLFAGIEDAFTRQGVLAYCMGRRQPAELQGSLGAIYFPSQADYYPASAEEFNDPILAGATLREQALKLGLLLGGVNVVHGLGAISDAHERAEFEVVYQACAAFAEQLRRAGMA